MSQPNKKSPSPGREALGKGIRSLLQNIDTDLKGSPVALQDKKTATGTGRIPVSQIEVNPSQPRHDFDKQALEELAQSIKIHDVIQPVTVSRTGNNQYRLISGERRLRAAKAAGLKDIPAYIRQADDDSMLELALLENLQREDLNAMEVSLSLKRLMEECDLTQEQLATRMGKERSTITNYLRLLKLPPDIQVAVRNDRLSMGHARALISIPEVEKQLYVFHKIEEGQLSVRQTEALVRKITEKSKKAIQKKQNDLSPELRKIQDDLSSHFSTKVKLNKSKKGNGHIMIEFYSDEELNHILELISR